MATVDTTLSTALTVRSTQVTLAAYTAPVVGFGARTLLLVNNAETMEVLSSIGRTLTVQRGYNGTTALAHAAGVTVTYGLSTEMTGPSVVEGPSGPQAVIDSASVDWTFSGGTGSASGSGSSIVHQATVTLTNAQMIALPTTGISVVAAPGASQLLVPVQAIGIITLVSVYTSITDASWSFAIGDTVASSVVVSSPCLMDGVLGSTGTFALSWVMGIDIAPGTLNFDGIIVTGGDSVNANKPLLIADIWGGIPNYGGGHASNTATISLSYLTLNTTTGVFV